MVSIQMSLRTHRGLVRESNQDTIGVSRMMTIGSPETLSFASSLDDPFLVAVADGMGGHLAGAHASRTAITRLLDLQDNVEDCDGIRQALVELNQSVFEESLLASDRSGMGTTVAGLWISSEATCAFNIGDSPIYEAIDGYLVKRSIDDVRRGTNGETLAITQSLGGTIEPVTVEPHLYEAATAPTRWLVCSDGLSSYVSLTTMQEIVSDSLDEPSPVVERLLAAALAAGAPDNVSVVVVDVVFGGV